MSYEYNGMSSVYESAPNRDSDTHEKKEMLEQMDKIKNDQMDQMVWAEAQGFALSKIQLYHKLAEKIVNQN